MCARNYSLNITLQRMDDSGWIVDREGILQISSTPPQHRFNHEPELRSGPT
jgi:hypothetical protein